MLKSSKQIGRFEKPLFKPLACLFEEEGYTVLTHTRLNIAWSNVISDIDVLARSDETIIITEVKSDHDAFYKGFDQLEKLKGFADKLYIATNRDLESLEKEKWRDKSIGLIFIGKQNAKIIRPAEPIRSLHAKDSLSQLKKKCLIRLARLLGVPTYLSKKAIEKRLRAKFNDRDLKIIVKNIILCDSSCSNDCILEPFLTKACNNLRQKETIRN
jgi:Holliday junction resolvase